MLHLCPFILLLVGCTAACSAQELNVLFPWINLDKRVQLGMREDSLKAVYPQIKPMDGMESSTASMSGKAEMYLDADREILGSEDLAFGVRNGVVTKFYWSSDQKTGASFLKEARQTLRGILGEPRVGYKARLTRERIAKVTTEVYSTGGFKDVIITLSSALGTTEVEVINMAAEGVTAEEMYFSYEKQKQQIQKQLASITGKVVEDEQASATNDALAALEDAPTNEAPMSGGSRATVPSAAREKESTMLANTAASETPTSSILWSVVAVLIVAGLGLLWVLLRRRS
jgi:hypothetical protein